MDGNKRSKLWNNFPLITDAKKSVGKLRKLSFTNKTLLESHDTYSSTKRLLGDSRSWMQILIQQEPRCAFVLSVGSSTVSQKNLRNPFCMAHIQLHSNDVETSSNYATRKSQNVLEQNFFFQMKFLRHLIFGSFSL